MPSFLFLPVGCAIIEVKHNVEISGAGEAAAAATAAAAAAMAVSFLVSTEKKYTRLETSF